MYYVYIHRYTVYLYLPTHLPTYILTYLPSIYLPVCLSVCLSVSLKACIGSHKHTCNSVHRIGLIIEGWVLKRELAGRVWSSSASYSCCSSCFLLLLLKAMCERRQGVSPCGGISRLRLKQLRFGSSIMILLDRPFLSFMQSPPLQSCRQHRSAALPHPQRPTSFFKRFG